MIRLTTPTHSFTFDSDPSLYARILITYKQGSRIVLNKEKEDLTVEEKQEGGETVWVASFRLTQEETKGFSANGAVKIQVRALAEDGTAFASEKYSLPVEDVLNDEVLV